MTLLTNQVVEEVKPKPPECYLVNNHFSVGKSHFSIFSKVLAEGNPSPVAVASITSPPDSTVPTFAHVQMEHMAAGVAGNFLNIFGC